MTLLTDKRAQSRVPGRALACSLGLQSDPKLQVGTCIPHWIGPASLTCWHNLPTACSADANKAYNVGTQLHSTAHPSGLLGQEQGCWQGTSPCHQHTTVQLPHVHTTSHHSSFQATEPQAFQSLSGCCVSKISRPTILTKPQWRHNKQHAVYF